MSLEQETEYTEPLDWAKVKPTMMVELRHSEYPAVAGKVASIHQYDRHHVGVWVEGAWRNELDGWTLWVKPDRRVEQQFGPAATSGYWLDGDQTPWSAPTTQRAWDRYGPWTELMTEGEWEATRAVTVNDYTVELGGQKFTKVEWEAIQTYARARVGMGTA